MDLHVLKQKLIAAAISVPEPAHKELNDLRQYSNLIMQLPAGDRKILSQALHPILFLPNQNNFSPDLVKRIKKDLLWLLRVQQEATYIIKTFNLLGIHPLILKGGALLERYPHRFKNRRMADLDLLIPISARKHVIHSLKQLGWVPINNLGEYFLDWTHAWAMKTPLGIGVDIHWHLMPEAMSPLVTDFIFSRSTLVNTGVYSFQKIDPTCLFFHLCVHGVRKQSGSGLQWIADVLIVLQEEQELEWACLDSLAKLSHLNLLLSTSLKILQNYTDRIPKTIIKALSTHSVSIYEKLEYKKAQTIGIRMRDKNPFAVIWEYAEWYYIWTGRFRSKGIRVNPIRFLKYYTAAESLVQGVRNGYELYTRWHFGRKQIRIIKKK